MSQAETVVRDDAPADVAAEPAAPSVSEAPASEAPAAASAPGDDLDSLLAEFDRLSGNRPSGAEQPAADDGDFDSLLGEVLASAEREQQWATQRQQFDERLAQSGVDLALRDGQIRELRGVVENLQRQAEQTRWLEHQRHSLTVFKNLCAEEQAKLEGLDVEPDHVESYLLAAAARDPELSHAFEAQFYQPPDPLHRAALERGIMEHGNQLARAAMQIADPQHRALAEQNIRQEMQRLYAATFPDPAKYRASAAMYVKKALAQMHKAAHKPRIDPAVSEDRALVAASVRSAGGTVRTEPPPQFGRLTTKELNRYTENAFGFTAV